jgi:hypothetical protein
VALDGTSSTGAFGASVVSHKFAPEVTGLLTPGRVGNPRNTAGIAVVSALPDLKIPGVFLCHVFVGHHTSAMATESGRFWCAHYPPLTYGPALSDRCASGLQCRIGVADPNGVDTVYER